MSDPISARPRWLKAYYVLAAITAATIIATLYLALRVMSVYSDSVRADHDWDLRRARFDSLTSLAFRMNAPANELFYLNDPRQETAALTAAYRQFETLLHNVRIEYRQDLKGTSRSNLMAELDHID